MLASFAVVALACVGGFLVGRMASAWLHRGSWRPRPVESGTTPVESGERSDPRIETTGEARTDWGTTPVEAGERSDPRIETTGEARTDWGTTPVEAGERSDPRIETLRADKSFVWVPFALAAVWGALAWRLLDRDLLGAWSAYAVLALIGVLLAAIDLAVHRLPDVLTLGGLPVITALLLVASVLENRWDVWPSAFWAAGLALFVYFVLVLGGLGLGDLKLAVLLALALGWLSFPTALIGLGLGFVLAGVWAMLLVLTKRATRHTTFAYGPWMLAGALIAVLVAEGP